DIQVGSTRLAPESHGEACGMSDARLALDGLDAFDSDASEDDEEEDDIDMEQFSDEYNGEEFTGFGDLDVNQKGSDSGTSDVNTIYSEVVHERQTDQEYQTDAANTDNQFSTDGSDSDPETLIRNSLVLENSTRASHILHKPVSDLATITTSSARRYVPPHLRKQESDPASERLVKIRKQVQGLLNRLSESNVESILSQAEDIYRNFPRAEVTSVFTTLLLQTLTNRANLLASFVSHNAAFVAALYRIIGTEAAAHFVQETIEQFDKGYEAALQREKMANPTVSETDAQDGDDVDADIVGKQCVNLIALVCELYNFQVISHVLVYDLLTVFAQEINEVNVELLLKMIKTCGYQLRHDDPVRLKETILAVNLAVTHVPRGHLNARTKFMLEVLNNLRTNRLREGSSGGDSVLRLKKFLGNLTAKRTTRSSEALGVSLEDIRCIETKGKWWLVGSTWSGHDEGILGTQSGESPVVQTASQDLLAMARRLNMNTDIRKSIFIVLMTSEDYVDCFERLTKLRLKEVQEREIARVLVQCCGSERIFNPYYSVIAERFCSYDHRFRVTFQYCLWDFLRLLGESSVGGLGRQTQGDSAEQDDTSFGNNLDASGQLPLHRVVNIAKFYAHLVSQQALGLGILKPVNFAKLKTQSQIFLQMLFIHIFLPRHAKQREDFDHLITTFSKVSAHSAVLAQGILFFLHAYVRSSALTKDCHEKQTVKWGCSIAKEVIESQASASAAQDYEM
ncbi:suppressor of glycerol defect, partial [Dispira simplex]